ncbi:MAG TPA: hypothetical protein VG323_03075 [Thermoanaerobaculia bacterium]|nr:hypothetical protein [Thermoanaerobaculia bacterium]
MIEGFEPLSLVIVNLVNPKEKFFGVLTSLSQAGVTLRGINLDSFDDWIRQVAHREEAGLDVTTMFFPLFRVERIWLDEGSGAIKSYGERFHDVTGTAIHTYLGLDRGH